MHDNMMYSKIRRSARGMRKIIEASDPRIHPKMKDSLIMEGARDLYESIGPDRKNKIDSAIYSLRGAYANLGSRRYGPAKKFLERSRKMIGVETRSVEHKIERMRLFRERSNYDNPDSWKEQVYETISDETRSILGNDDTDRISICTDRLYDALLRYHSRMDKLKDETDLRNNSSKKSFRENHLDDIFDTLEKDLESYYRLLLYNDSHAF